VFIWRKKNFFSRTSGPNSIKLDTSHPWVKEFKIVPIMDQILCKGDIITKMWWSHLKIFTARTTEPEELIFTCT
jgi:hypothetical protein